METSAAVLHAVGKPLVVERVELAPLRPHDVLVRVRTRGLSASAPGRAMIRVARFGVPLDGCYEFFFAPQHCGPVLARLRRDLAGSALRPDQVAHFFAGHGGDAVSSLVLATGLLGADRQRLTA